MLERHGTVDVSDVSSSSEMEVDESGSIEGDESDEREELENVASFEEQTETMKDQIAKVSVNI